MRYILSILIGLLVLINTTNCYSQQRVEAKVVDNDTIPYFTLPIVSIMDEIGKTGKVRRDRYHELIYDVKEVYPFAKFFASKMHELDSALKAIDGSSEKKAFLKKEEKKLKAKLKTKLKDLTYDQGHILIKLINRETGKTSYDLIKRYKSGLKAMFWQSAASVFGMNLKEEYDKDKEEAIERILDALEKHEDYDKDIVSQK